MKRCLFGWIAFLLISCTGPSTEKVTPPSAPTPADLKNGEALFTTNCARCHGTRGTGTGFGPPFLSPIYEPNHHADAAFHFAARNGVQAHHWNFGNMPPYSHLSDPEVDEIVRYVRWLQKEAGIF